MRTTIRMLEEALKEMGNTALCMVVETGGSTPVKAGAKMVVRENGTSMGTVGGGALEKAVTGQALQAIRTGKGGLYRHRLVKDLGMCCGGSVTVYIEPLRPPFRLYIFGGGHVGKALAEHAVPLDFDTTVVDDRPRIFDGWEAGRVTCVRADPAKAVTMLGWDERTFAVIMTYDHRLDRNVLARCIRLPAGYIGMIGSKRKAAVTRRLFTGNGIATEEELGRVDMPLGLDIGSQTPQEIAISILGRLIEVRNRTRAVHGQYTPGRPHEEEAASRENINNCTL